MAGRTRQPKAPDCSFRSAIHGSHERLRNFAGSLGKITPPVTGAIVHRERLYRQLDDTESSPLVWICGQGGAGKTTLGAGYLTSRQIPCLWYQMDEKDADVATLFYYLGAAARRAAPRYRKPLPLLAPEYLTDFATFGHRFFSKLLARFAPPLVIVLDNFQKLPGNSPFPALISALPDLLPPGVRLFLISRETPSSAFAVARSSGLMTLIGGRQLRLDQEETALLVRLREGSDLPQQIVRQLHQETDGWAAGLVLLLEHARLHGFDAGAGSLRTSQEIFDYFASQILTGIDHDTERLLLTTSLFSRFSPELVRELTSLQQAPHILETLSRRNFFITRHDVDHTCYQYHPLFREFLMARTKLRHTVEELAELQRKAAAVALSWDHIDDAARLLADSEDWPGLAALLCSQAKSLSDQGRRETLAAWIRGVPHEVKAACGWLLFWEAACLAPVNPLAAQQGLEAAAVRFDMEGSRNEMLMALAQSADMSLHSGEFASMSDWIVRVLPLLAGELPDVAPEVIFQITMSLLNALSSHQPEHPDLPFWRDRALRLLRSNPNLEVNLRARSMVNLALDRLWIGDLDLVAELIHHLRGMSKDPALTDLHRVMILGMDAAYAVNADLAAVKDIVTEGLALARRSGIRLYDNHFLGFGVLATFSTGDRETESFWRQQWVEIIDTGRRIDVALLHETVAWSYLMAHEPALALRHQAQALSLVEETAWNNVKAPFLLVMALCLHACGKPDQASEYLRQAWDLSWGMQSRLYQMWCGAVEAELLFARHQVAEGLVMLASALKLWRELGIDNIIFWRPSVMADLCRRALDADIEPDFVRMLIRKRDIVPETPPLLTPRWPWPLRIITLGEFRVIRDDVPLLFGGKVPKKQMELLRALIAFGGRNVSVAQLSDRLWPEADGDTAHQSFATTLYRLRQVLGCDEVLIFQESRLSLDPRRVWLDTWAFERAVAEASAAWDEPSVVPDHAVTLTIRALALYQGEFLPEDRTNPWSVATRLRFRSKYSQTVAILGRYWESVGNLRKAIAVYSEALERENLSEECYQQLMLCHYRLGQKSEAVQVYQRCRIQLEQVLGVTPSVRTEEIYCVVSSP